MRKILVSGLVDGQMVDCSFAIYERRILQTKEKKDYLSLELADRSGTIPARMWDNLKAVLPFAQVGTVVRVIGVTQNYNGILQIKVSDLQPLNSAEYCQDDFLPPRRHSQDSQVQLLHRNIGSVANPWLLTLLNSFFLDQEFLHRFADAPAAKIYHHAYLGGLLDHTLAVVAILERVIEIHPELDRALLITAGLLHDAGKVETYVQQGFVFDFTDCGRLLDHVVLLDRKVQVKILQISGFPPDLAVRLSHALLSHHGERENGSPVLPMTAEAVALYHADNLDAQVQQCTELLEGTPSGERWTKFRHNLGKALFVGERAATDPEPSSID
ncbi:MAG: HD domain-containing protein [Coprothermobacterota bacterium]|nr:HD domain-containing protein [Coprothermobacterota bacterium]